MKKIATLCNGIAQIEEGFDINDANLEDFYLQELEDDFYIPQ